MNAYNSDLLRDLTRAIGGNVRFDAATRALYATDASNYRQPPIGVVVPRETDDVLAAVAICREYGVPVLPRGAGTSIAGQTCNEAVVIDTSRHLTGILEIDPQRRLARVQPGVVLDQLIAATRPHGLTFGPDPSTHSRCTVGGMIGNNACGAHSVSSGKTVDNVESLDVLRYDGTRLTVGPTPHEMLAALVGEDSARGRLYATLATLAEQHRALIRRSFPRLPRRVSGYNLDQLLPEHGFNLARALVGTEGTCATVLEATLRLVPEPAARTLLVAGFPDLPAAADAVPVILGHRPLAVEGIGRALVDCLPPGRRSAAVATLPAGNAWLLIEVAGDSPADAARRASRLAAELRTEAAGAGSLVVADPARQVALWRIREEGAGLATRLPDGREAWSGWEDAAVPPDRLGGYLRDFEHLMQRHGRRGVAYGHFGDGCVHVRIDFDLLSAGGVADFRRFMEEAADLVAGYGGSLSGEHGDGHARAELLPRMYQPEVLHLFERFKCAWDPDNRMNPNKIVKPFRLDEHLRVIQVGVAPPIPEGGFAYHPGSGGFAGEMRRCVGVGKCVQTEPGSAVMCPSYLVTLQEEHSTRGRAHLLFEMLQGQLIPDGWRSDAVHHALDLCLSCKGCKSDCPVNVDMATYKAEFLHHRYRGRLRPAAHYSMGFLPVWARLASLTPRLTNAVARHRLLGRMLKRVGGVTPERPLPRLATRPFTRWLRGRAAPTGAPVAPRHRGPVMVWPDTFTNFFHPQVGQAATEVLEAAGFEVSTPPRGLCCGLTWVSTGQLGMARRVLRRTLARLEPVLDGRTPIVGLEPSCTSALRSDLVELLPDDERAARLAAQVRTLAEVLEELGPETLPGPVPGTAIVQTHCHQHAVLGDGADRVVLDRLGLSATVLDSGCCGLAGNFGFERGHYEVSMAVGERVLLPAVRAADEQTMLIADGFSCRTQIEQATGRRALHLAEVIRSGLPPRPRA